MCDRLCAFFVFLFFSFFRVFYFILFFNCPTRAPSSEDLSPEYWRIDASFTGLVLPNIYQITDRLCSVQTLVMMMMK